MPEQEVLPLEAPKSPNRFVIPDDPTVTPSGTSVEPVVAESVPDAHNTEEQAPSTEPEAKPEEVTPELAAKREGRRFERKLDKAYRAKAEQQARADILEKHVRGELGNNELLDHKALCYLNFNETTRCVYAMANDFLQSHACADDAVRLYLTELERFTLCRKRNVFDFEGYMVAQFSFNFEVISQVNFRVDVHSMNTQSCKYKFFHDDRQSAVIKKGSQMYGDSVSGLGRFIQRHKMSKMFRHFESCQ